MGVFKRIKDMTVASIHEMLDKVEDPVIMLNQYIREMEQEIAQVEVAVARQIANERKIKARWDEAIRISSDKEAQASQALKNGQEAVARKALEEKLIFDSKITELVAAHAQAKEQAEQLVQQLQQLKEQFYQMRNKRNELVQRANMAKVQKQIAQVTSVNPVVTGNAAQGFQRMEEKILNMEVEAQVARASAAYPIGYTMTPSVNQANNEQIDSQIKELKSKLGLDSESVDLNKDQA